MPYKFATHDQNYSDLASGRVIYNLPGAPAFPVRLASEILQRSWSMMGRTRRMSIYDPTCGGAFHLCAIGFLHGDWIESISASDFNETVLKTAVRNLGLLSLEGLSQREREIKHMVELYGKPSHVEALHSVAALRSTFERTGSHILTHVFQANAFNSSSMQTGLAGKHIDLVFSDVPYGLHSHWETSGIAISQSHSPIWAMLDALKQVVSPQTVIAIASDKRQKTEHPDYQRIDQFGLGKRQITFLIRNENSM